MKTLDLQLFAGSYTLTVTKGDNITTASAASTTGLAKDDEVVLTITPASGYEEVVEVIAGGATYDPATKKVKMGEGNAVVTVTAKADNLYMVTEECKACVNGGAWTELHRNAKVVLTRGGAIRAVECDGTEVTVDAGVQNLIDSGILIKL